jgi:uncharacterized iron-regulated membrane protein
MGFFNRPQDLFWRKAVFQIHLWSGVIVGLYIIAISISGSILVFETDLMDHRPLTGSSGGVVWIDYSKVVDAAQSAYPSEPLASIDMRSKDRRIVTVVLKTGKRQRTVYVDAVSAQVRSAYIQEERHGFLLWLEDFHNELAGGSTGGLINGIGGAILALLCVTGILIWWPGIKTWQRALRVQWAARWVRINYDLHSAVGFWTLLFVGMWGVSGAFFIFPLQIEKALGMFQNSASTRVSTWRPGERLLPIGDYVDEAKRAFGDADLAFLYMDVFRPQGQVTVFLSRDPSVSLTLLEDIVRMDPATGQVLQIEGTRRWSLAERIAMASYAIHFGDFGGNFTKAIWVILGLMPAVLAVTGYLMWWNRYLSKRWRALFSGKGSFSVR